MSDSIPTTSEQVQQRKAKLAALREKGVAYPNQFKRAHLSAELHAQYADDTADALAEAGISVSVAGRIMTRRIMGKASFTTIQDMKGRIQLYVARDLLPEGVYAEFKTWDLGDIVGVNGTLFRTKTGELSIKASAILLLTKALRPLPDKYHGLANQEQRLRQRYLDLIANQEVRTVFEKRFAIIAAIRDYFTQADYLEVETPMMHSLIGGAAARPFETHHNALNMPLYLRIAPELYLKRLVVGGFEKVFEVNRNFRNEGVSTRHNPEFTMLEFYEAYATYETMMAHTETVFQFIGKALGQTHITYQGTEIDLSQPFARMSVTESLLHYCQSITPEQLATRERAAALAESHDITVKPEYGLGKIHMLLFEELVESQLKQPTFITAFPTEVSPLARANDDDPSVTDRFELYVGGQEIANGFSELNDPEDQAARFQAQLDAKAAGEAETMDFDADYITALEHGLPPTAGEGIGIDRLTMLFTDTASIREVILFPLLRHKTT